MFARGKKKVQMEFTDLSEQREVLSGFLRKTLKVDVTSARDGKRVPTPQKRPLARALEIPEESELLLIVTARLLRKHSPLGQVS